MEINHLVITGGCLAGFPSYGILKESNKSGFWKIENIKSIYATSIGTMNAIWITLNYDWDTLDNYIINRPWHTVFKYDFAAILNAIQTCGIFNVAPIEQMFLPVFSGKNISINVTMAEYYEITKIDIHMYTVDMVSFKLIDLSHTTHPNWRIIDAIYCSCSLPILFAPFLKDGMCFMDGGVLMNYPLAPCIATANNEGVFGINCKLNDNISINSSTLFDYMFSVLNKIIKHVMISHQHMITRDSNITEIYVGETPASIYDIFEVASKPEERRKLIEAGVEIWKLYNSVDKLT